MGHHHDHTPANFSRAFAIGVALNAGFVIIEVAFGLIAHSLALVADAGHNLSDVLGLVLAWGASVLATRHPTLRRTYGMRRSSILAAAINAVLLLIVTGAVSWEAIRRLAAPEVVAGKTVIVVALVGVVVNGVTALLFASGRKGDLNVRAAFAHMAADAGLALGVALSGVAILVTGWHWLDPVTSLGIGLVILFGTWGILRDSVNLALDAVPEEVDPAAVRAYLTQLPDIVEVHDLHIWAMSTTETALTTHLVTALNAQQGDALLAQVGHELHDRFGIEHATLQIEHGDFCDGCPLHVAAAG